MASRDKVEKARQRLIAAGVDVNHQMVQLFLSDDATIESILDPTGGIAFVATLAGSIPSESKSLYDEISGTFDTAIGEIPATLAGTQAAFSYVPSKGGYERNAEGVVRYNNGVFYDPNSDQVVWNHSNPEQEGSLAWFEKVQENWSEEKLKTWRKRLNQFGYTVSDKGGWDQTFKAALSDFFLNKYKNLGKPLPIDQAAGLTKADFGGTLDPAVLRNEVRGWYETAFGDDPTDEELTYWSDKLEKSAKRIARNQGLEPSAAVNVAHARQQEAFRTSPDVVAQREVDEELEENQTLRNKFISLAQIASM